MIGKNALLNRRTVLSLTGAGMAASLAGGVVGDVRTRDTASVDDPTQLTVGANYYTWYGRGDHVDWLGETPEDPTLGAYDARDPEVIDQHLDWCRTYGIGWLSMTWWGANSPEDVTLRDHVLSRSLGDVSYSILYETPGMLTADDDGTFDLSDDRNRRQLVDDVAYLAETYFHDPNYRRIDGRPVLYLYIAREFRGDVTGVFDAMRAAAPDGLYIIADLIRFGPPLATDGPLIEAADAVTSYNMYAPLEDINEDFVTRATGVYDEWVDPLATQDTEFIPVVIPGYNDSQLTHVSRDNPILEASPERFQEFCRQASQYATAGASSLFITSFNEWYENSQIEPSERFGTEYLDVVRQEFGTISDSAGTVELTLAFDRTVSENELNDSVTDPRELAMQCFAMELRDENDAVLAAYDVGTETAEPEFGSGAYSPESLDGVDAPMDSWRWFGGSGARTTLYIPDSLGEATSLVLTGGAAEGEIGVRAYRAGSETGTVTLDGRPPGEYRLSLTTPTAEPPAVATRPPTDVTASSVSLVGDLQGLGGEASVRTSFDWRRAGSDAWTRTSGQTRDTTGQFTAAVDGLAAGIDYEYRAVGTTGDGTVSTGDTVRFTTAVGNTGPSIDTYSVTEAGNATPHCEIAASWSVSDDDGNLDTVVLQAFGADGSLADVTSTDVTGSAASVSGTEGIDIAHADGGMFNVVLTVIDTHGNSTSETRTVTE